MHKRVVLITDTHWGCRGDSPQMLVHFNRFYNDIFFPYCKTNGIDHIIHLGDLVDRRKFINYVTARHLHKTFINPIIDMGIQLDIIIGNHDTTYKNTNEVNGADILYGSYGDKNINIYTKPEEVLVKDIPILYIPWICSETHSMTMEKMKTTKAQLVMGHLELSGFEMYRGSICDNGLDPKLFSNFDMVMTGHFHHKSQIENIHYLGAPYEMTWSDYNDNRGFHELDLSTRELKFISNPYRLFHKIFYDDLAETQDQILKRDYSKYNNTYCKVIIKNKTSSTIFDLFIDILEKQNPIDLQVVDDHLNLDLKDDQEIIDEAESTTQILDKFIDGLNLKIDKTDLKKLMHSLYNEAVSMET